MDTDAHGTDERNDRLSMGGATVLGYLTRAGVDKGRLEAQDLVSENSWVTGSVKKRSWSAGRIRHH